MLNINSFTECTKIVDKSTNNSIFDSICTTYEGNQQVKEAETNLLVQQY